MSVENEPKDKAPADPDGAAPSENVASSDNRSPELPEEDRPEEDGKEPAQASRSEARSASKPDAVIRSSGLPVASRRSAMARQDLSSHPTIARSLAAINRFETFNKGRSFKAFHIEHAIRRKEG